MPIGYKLYDPVNRKVVISIDVNFYERLPHVHTSEWKGEGLQGNDDEHEFKTHVTYRRCGREEKRRGQRSGERKSRVGVKRTRRQSVSK